MGRRASHLPTQVGPYLTFTLGRIYIVWSIGNKKMSDPKTNEVKNKDQKTIRQ